MKKAYINYIKHIDKVSVENNLIKLLVNGFNWLYSFD